MPGLRHSANKNEELSRLWNMGVPLADIGQRLRMTVAAVREHASRIGLGPHGGHRVAPAALVATAAKTIRGKVVPPEKSTWKRIAVQHLGGPWHELPGAPWPLEVARRMERDGQLMTAQRREGADMVLVVKEYQK